MESRKMFFGLLLSQITLFGYYNTKCAKYNKILNFLNKKIIWK